MPGASRPDRCSTTTSPVRRAQYGGTGSARPMATDAAPVGRPSTACRRARTQATQTPPSTSASGPTSTVAASPRTGRYAAPPSRAARCARRCRSADHDGSAPTTARGLAPSCPPAVTACGVTWRPAARTDARTTVASVPFPSTRTARAPAVTVLAAVTGRCGADAATGRGVTAPSGATRRTSASRTSAPVPSARPARMRTTSWVTICGTDRPAPPPGSGAPEWNRSGPSTSPDHSPVWFTGPIRTPLLPAATRSTPNRPGCGDRPVGPSRITRSASAPVPLTVMPASVRAAPAASVNLLSPSTATTACRTAASAAAGSSAAPARKAANGWASRATVTSTRASCSARSAKSHRTTSAAVAGRPAVAASGSSPRASAGSTRCHTRAAAGGQATSAAERHPSIKSPLPTQRTAAPGRRVSSATGAHPPCGTRAACQGRPCICWVASASRYAAR